jgi:N-acetylglutamate synthase-like GNAT family acetyltransferase
MTHELTQRTAERGELERIASFYLENGYDSPLDDEDTFLVVEDGGHIVAALRLCHEQGVIVLRGMQVRQDCQRRGIGSTLLRYAASVLGENHCYCIPYSYLERFYEGVGFVRIDPLEAPAFLRERWSTYMGKLGLDVILMRRAGFHS